MRLGRHVRHDSESLRYLHKRDPRRVIVAQLWPRLIPILDQGDLGSCTGNMAEGNVGTSPLFDAIPGNLPARPTTNAAGDEQQAVSLYSAATKLDPYSGSYPPTDTGSDGLSVAKAALAAGLISGYTHITSLADMEDALQLGPVGVGVNWYSSFDTPNSSGYVTISSGAYVRGGHEFLVRGVDPSAQRFRADNSWGLSYGVAGSFSFSYATMERLLSEQGDCTRFVPLNVPAPTPTPVPGDPDNAFAAVLLAQNALGHAWVDQHHTGYVTKVAQAGRTWIDAKDLG